MISLRGVSRVIPIEPLVWFLYELLRRYPLPAKTRRLATLITFSYVSQMGRALARWKALVELVSVMLLDSTLVR